MAPTKGSKPAWADGALETWPVGQLWIRQPHMREAQYTAPEASKRALSNRWRSFSEKLRGSLKRDKRQTCLAGSTRTHLLVTLPKFCRNSHEAFKIPLHDAHASGNHRLPQGACVQGYAASGKQGSQGRAAHTRRRVYGLGLNMQNLS